MLVHVPSIYSFLLEDVPESSVLPIRERPSHRVNQMLQLNILSTKEILRTRIPGRNMMKWENELKRTGNKLKRILNKMRTADDDEKVFYH